MPLPVLLLILAAVIILLIGGLVILRTARFLTSLEPVESVPPLDIAPELVAEHLASAIRCETVTGLNNENVDRSAMFQLHRVLERWYPRVHEFVMREYIQEYSLLYTWKGSRPDLPGVLLAAHLDVVPVDPASAANWQHPPFGGEVADGYVWGRGALDLKSQLVTILAGIEQLIVQGYRPERTVYLAFGHDEEGPSHGARAIAAELERRGVELAAVLDEGGFIAAPGLLPGVEEPAALVGTSEKGMLALRIWVDTPAGHSAMPPAHSAIGVLAQAINRLEASPLPARLDWVTGTYLSLGSAAAAGTQMALANQWLLGNSARRQLSRTPEANAVIRTTTAVTVMRGGIKENVLPTRAEAVVNFRLLPGDSIASVCEHVRRAVADARIQMEAVEGGAWEASPVSPTDVPAYVGLEDTIRRVFQSIPVAPFLVVGATDARFYAGLSPNVYRFTPYVLSEADVRTIHGVDERIRVDILERMVSFYMELVRCWAGDEMIEKQA